MTDREQAMFEKLLEENRSLRHELAILTQDNIRLKAALDDTISVLNSARSRLETAARPSSIAVPFALIGEEDAVQLNDNPPDVAADPPEAMPEAAPEAPIPSPLRVVSHIQFMRLDIRFLSDGTLEADTPEGPLRFEDFDHLHEVFAERWPEQIGRQAASLARQPHRAGQVA